MGGGSLFSLRSDDAGREFPPNKTDVENNAAFIEPFLRAAPARNPSKYFMADVLLYAHDMLGSKLSVNAQNDHPTSIALNEAKKVGGLLSHVRYMSRGGRSTSSSPAVGHLKRTLTGARDDADDEGDESDVSESSTETSSTETSSTESRSNETSSDESDSSSRARPTWPPRTRPSSTPPSTSSRARRLARVSFRIPRRSAGGWRPRSQRPAQSTPSESAGPRRR